MCSDCCCIGIASANHGRIKTNPRPVCNNAPAVAWEPGSLPCFFFFLFFPYFFFFLFSPVFFFLVSEWSGEGGTPRFPKASSPRGEESKERNENNDHNNTQNHGRFPRSRLQLSSQSMGFVFSYMRVVQRNRPVGVGASPWRWRVPNV